MKYLNKLLVTSRTQNKVIQKKYIAFPFYFSTIQNIKQIQTNYKPVHFKNYKTQITKKITKNKKSYHFQICIAGSFSTLWIITNHARNGTPVEMG